jgi:hypothetical protein
MVCNSMFPDGNEHLIGREEWHGGERFICRLQVGRSNFIALLVERGLPRQRPARVFRVLVALDVLELHDGCQRLYRGQDLHFHVNF